MRFSSEMVSGSVQRVVKPSVILSAYHVYVV
jgi:hypothetical protein